MSHLSMFEPDLCWWQAIFEDVDFRDWVFFLDYHWPPTKFRHAAIASAARQGSKFA